jgi:hypothetical protein
MLNEDYRDMLHALSDGSVAKKWSRIRRTDSIKSKSAKVKDVPHFLGIAQGRSTVFERKDPRI